MPSKAKPGLDQEKIGRILGSTHEPSSGSPVGDYMRMKYGPGSHYEKMQAKKAGKSKKPGPKKSRGKRPITQTDIAEAMFGHLCGEPVCSISVGQKTNIGSCSMCRKNDGDYRVYRVAFKVSEFRVCEKCRGLLAVELRNAASL